MDIRVTSSSNQTALVQTNAKKSVSTYEIEKSSSTSNSLVVADKQSLSQSNIKQPVLSNVLLPTREAVNKKGVSLYQQIEREKPLINDAELINRFHFEA